MPQNRSRSEGKEKNLWENNIELEFKGEVCENMNPLELGGNSI
jgi:hypothetical protein